MADSNKTPPESSLSGGIPPAMNTPGGVNGLNFVVLVCVDLVVFWISGYWEIYF